MGKTSIRLPLFLRIFALMMGTLLLVQAMNFALVVLVPPPRPEVTDIDTIADALRKGRVSNDNIEMIVDDKPVTDTPRPPGGGLQAVLAHELGISERDVRLHFEDQLGPGPDMQRPGPGGPPPLRQMPPPDRERSAALLGHFEVSAKIGGEWRTVRSTRGLITPWRWRALLWLATALAVLAPLAWYMARIVARPIGIFADAAERLGQDIKAPSLSLEGPPEVANAAAAFNRMQSRLNRYVEERANLMAAIAHDLRTPLMRLGLRLENAPPDLREACERDVHEMEQMIASVMAFLRDINRRERQRLDLRSLAQSVTDNHADLGEDVALEEGPSVVIEGDATALKSLLSNLIGNAIKYAGSARVRMESDDADVVIEVSDNGPGMQPEDIARAFEPFFRAERSRNRDTGGVGMGLAIVRAVARAHGGDATLANRQVGGLVARVVLPVAR